MTRARGLTAIAIALTTGCAAPRADWVSDPTVVTVSDTQLAQACQSKRLDLAACERQFAVQVESCGSEDGVTELHGTTDEGADFFVVFNDESMLGAIRGAGAGYSLAPGPDGSVTCTQLDLAAMPVEIELDATYTVGGPAATPSSQRPWPIDILVVFPDRTMVKTDDGFALGSNNQYCTPQGRTHPDNAKLVAHAVRSELTPYLGGFARIDKVATECIRYDAKCLPEAGDSECIDRNVRWMLTGDESIFQRDPPGANDGLRARRDDNQADVVMMWVPHSYHTGAAPTRAETAYVDGRDHSEGAYMVVNSDAALARLSLAHEFGHLMGLRHDRPYYGSCESGIKEAGHCNYGSAVFASRDGIFVPVGYTIMGTSSVCRCAREDQRKLCEVERFATYSYAKQADADMIYGFACSPDDPEGPFDKQADAYKYIERATASISAYR